MKSNLLLALLAAVLLTLAPAAAQAGPMGALSATELGMSGVAVSNTPLSLPIVMDDRTNEAPLKEHFNQLTLAFTVAWGTSTYLNVQCYGSVDNGSTYKPVMYCSGTNPKTCAPYLQKYQASDGTTFVYNQASNYSHMKCSFDDPLDGTGTVTVAARRGLQ